MDDQIRRLERLAATGDYEARLQWRHAIIRAGYRDPDAPDPLTEWDEVQSHYDDLAWQRTTAGRMGWDYEPRPGCGKAHHTWGHRGWNPNSKRQTMRTHRDGSRKNYRLKGIQEHKEVVETAHARRRKKRYGGRGTPRRVYYWHPVTGAFRAWWEISRPNLEE